MLTSVYDNLVLEANLLLTPVSYDYDAEVITESILISYGVKEDEVVKDPKRAVTSINRMRVKRDIRAIIKILEIIILAVLAYKVSSYILSIVFTAGVAAIIWIIYKIQSKLIGPAVTSVRTFFDRYIYKVETILEVETDKDKQKTLKDLKGVLTDGLNKIESAEKKVATIAEDTLTDAITK